MLWAMPRHGAPPPGNELHNAGIRVVLPRGMLQRLDAIVDRANGETRSAVIRRALKEHLERHS